MNAAFAEAEPPAALRRFDVRTILRAAETERATLLRRRTPLRRVPLDAVGELRSLVPAFEVAGASTASPTSWCSAKAARTGCPIYQGYGLTETSPPPPLPTLPDQHRMGSVGKRVPGVRVRIVDADDREVLRADWGEIRFRGPGIMQGYWNQPGETARGAARWLAAYRTLDGWTTTAISSSSIA
ncbi:MAG: AMP-binding protein [Burkholderiales bacterium]